MTNSTHYKKNQPWHACAGKKVWTCIPGIWKQSHIKRYRGEGSNVFFTWVLVEFTVLALAVIAVAVMLWASVSKPDEMRIAWNAPFVSASVGVPFSVSVSAHTETAVSVRLHVPDTVIPIRVPETYDSKTQTFVLFPGEFGETFVFVYTGDVMTSDSIVAELIEGKHVYRDALPVHAYTGMVTVSFNPTETNWECEIENIGRVPVEQMRVRGHDFSYDVFELLPGNAHVYSIPDSAGVSAFDMDDYSVFVSGTAYGADLILYDRYPEIAYSETNSEYIAVSFKDDIQPGIETTMRIALTNASGKNMYDTQIGISNRYPDILTFGHPDGSQECVLDEYLDSDTETNDVFYFAIVPKDKTVVCDIPVHVIEQPSIAHTAHVQLSFPGSLSSHAKETESIRDTFAVSARWVNRPEQCIHVSEDDSILIWTILNRYAYMNAWSYAARIREGGSVGSGAISTVIPNTRIEPDYMNNEVRWSGSFLPAGAGYSRGAFSIRIPIKNVTADMIVDIVDLNTNDTVYTYVRKNANCGVSPFDLIY